MYVPSGYGKIRKEDYTITPFIANKRYSIPASQAPELGYTVRTANYYTKKFPISSSKASYINAPTSSDGTLNYLNWFSLDHLYYRNPYDRGRTFEGFRQTKIEKNLYLTASFISAPYNDMGEGFKEGTIYLTGSIFDLRDDKEGNLYDNDVDTSNFLNQDYLDAYWSFDDLYITSIKGYKKNLLLTKPCFSNTIDFPKASNYSNVNIDPGVEVDFTSSGAGISFTQQPSYVSTPHVDKLDYETTEDFTLSFWVKAPPSQSNFNATENHIISKRRLRNIDRFGEFPFETDNGTKVQRIYQRTDEEVDPVDYYPYEFSIYNSSSNKGKIKFTRSDAISTLILTSSIAINDGTYHHICTVKTGSLVHLYVDGTLQGSKNDVRQQPINTHTIIFGALDKSGTNQFSGSIDEVRFYSKGASALQVSSSLANKTDSRIYQTNKVGNVYYKRGEVVITSRIDKYHRYFALNDYTLQYRNKYNIFEYETLVRVKAGTFNRSTNPSSKKSRKSDEYLNEFTGSLSPYITSIGLYNKNYELVAVGKLGRPIKARDDVDMNFIVRFDY
jgi:hypothetical protein